MGNGDKANGKLMVETLIENNTIGGNFIKYGFDLNIFIGNPNDKEENKADVLVAEEAFTFLEGVFIQKKVVE